VINLEEIEKILKKTHTKKPVGIGDIVYGKIVVVKEKMVVVSLDHADNNKVLSPADSGVIFISNVAQGYVKNIEDFLKKGDVVKAKVIEITPYEFKLTIAEPELGVIKGHCIKCKQEINNSGTEQVRCFNCGTIQTKKFVKIGE
jgi:exosome complex RNA-binding protein Csl4